MALVKPVIFQIAGFQNSGKTTLSLKIIEHLSADGLKVATIKHHGHGGKPDVLETKDSGRHISAGATVSLVEGGGRILIQAENGHWSLTEEIEMLSFFKPNAIIIEGHKNEGFPKAVILRDENDMNLVEKLTNVKVFFYRDANILPRLKNSKIPSFKTDDIHGYQWIENYIKKHQ